MAGTNRQRAIAKALTALLPLAPYIDAEKIRADANAPHLKTLPPSIAVWLATVAHVRHAHTEYENLLGEGYDRDAARFFVIDADQRGADALARDAAARPGRRGDLKGRLQRGEYRCLQPILLATPSPARYARHLSPTPWGRGTAASLALSSPP